SCRRWRRAGDGRLRAGFATRRNKPSGYGQSKPRVGPVTFLFQQDYSAIRRVLSASAGTFFIGMDRRFALVLQYRQPKPHKSSLPLAAVESHASGIRVQNLQALGYIGHADTRAAKSTRAL